jgi:hypothetical protein
VPHRFSLTVSLAAAPTVEDEDDMLGSEMAHLNARILFSGSVWTDREHVVRTIGLSDILIVAPYNAQVFDSCAT